MTMFPRLSQDAAITLGLAGTSILHARDEHDAAERWVRVLRLYGLVGTAMQALGVGESPLETAAVEPSQKRRKPHDVPGADEVTERARDMALHRGAPAVGTVDILFACFDLYGSAFDRALYVRGTSREELLERIAYEVERVPPV
jgi:hypothetical protein